LPVLVGPRTAVTLAGGWACADMGRELGFCTPARKQKRAQAGLILQDQGLAVDGW